MELQHIELDRLSVSKANMRHARKAPDISDILPSVKARGVLVPLLVRPNGEDRHYEIVAGRRRYHAALAAAEGQENPLPLPCAVLEDGDDAAALEASLIENVARADPDEVTKWETFTRLVKEGKDIEDIAATFGLSLVVVRRILALGNLLPAIRAAYRAEDIDPATIRHLTLATKAQQKTWLDLFRSEDSYAPRGHQLKAWLFGGASVSVEAALFDIASYEGQVITDLFEEDGYFADADQFWTAQNTEIEKRSAQYLEEGWSAVEVLPPERYFQSWDYVHVAKTKGGKVYVDVRSNGEVAFHEGYLTRREAQGRESGQDREAVAQPVARSEVTAAMNDYVNLHRHAAVRTALAGNTGLALRVMVAHAICGSPLWHVRLAEPNTRDERVLTSLAVSAAEARLAERRSAILSQLGFDEEEPSVVPAYGCSDGIVDLVRHLMTLDDEAVLGILAMVMAETLASGTDLIELLGTELGIDMADWWSADAAFLELIRDREVLTALLSDVAGEAVAKAHAGEKAATLKRVIADCLEGTNGRDKCERWVPRWMAFPPSAYTDRGGVASVSASQWLMQQLEDNRADAEAMAEAAE